MNKHIDVRRKTLLLSHLVALCIGFLLMQAMSRRDEIGRQGRIQAAIETGVETQVAVTESRSYQQGPTGGGNLPVPEPIFLSQEESDRLIASGTTAVSLLQPSVAGSEPFGIPHGATETTTTNPPDSIRGRRLRRYEQVFSDSLLVATVDATVDGSLIDWNFRYVPNFPVITRQIVVTNTVTNTVNHYPPKTAILLGVRAWSILGTDPIVAVGPSVGLRRGLFSVEYTPSIPVFGLNPGVLHHVEVGATIPIGL